MKVCVLHSGGLDSNLAVAEALRDPEVTHVHSLTFDYGQSNSPETSCAEEMCAAWGVPHTYRELQLGAQDAHKEVPARNLIFIAQALEWCLHNGFDTISIGSEPDGGHIDSREPFLSKSSDLCALFGVRVIAPVRHHATKLALLHRALDLGVPLHLCHSSFGAAVDGECGTSRRFLEAIGRTFPGLDPKDILHVLGRLRCEDTPNGKSVQYAGFGSFKVAPALFSWGAHPALQASMPSLDVYSSGSWAHALGVIGDTYGKNMNGIRFHVPAAMHQYIGQLVNTSSRAGMWGIKQAMSMLPRPQVRPDVMRQVAVIQTQGHLRAALEDLGYEVTTMRECTGMVIETQVI